LIQERWKAAIIALEIDHRLSALADQPPTQDAEFNMQTAVGLAVIAGVFFFMVLF
jgi:hypothetical protein